MPTRLQSEDRKEFLKYSKKYDNLDTRYFSMSRNKRGYSYYVAIRKSRNLQFKIKYQDNGRYRIVTFHKSSVNVPKELSVKRFDTPKEALDATAVILKKMGYKVYTSNAIDFIWN